MRIFISSCILMILFNSVNAQIKEYYYRDTEQKEGGKILDHIKYNNSIIIAGRSFDKVRNQPAIIRIDTLGNTIWNTTNNDTSASHYVDAYAYKILLSDGYIYAIIRNKWNNQKEIWKINVLDGIIIWKKSFYAESDPEHMVDFDSNKLIIGYKVGYYGAVYNLKIAFFDKNTGDTLSTYKIGNIYWTDKYGLNIDNDKNIYYTLHDTIFKVSSSNPNNIIWKVNYNSAHIQDFQQIYIDQNDSIFLFGRRIIYGNGKAISICKKNGGLNWLMSASMTTAVAFQDMVDKNNVLYVTWIHTLVGSSSDEATWTYKIDKKSGLVIWNSAYKFIGIGSPANHSGGHEGAMSLDVDTKGDIYLTGYYGDTDYGPECWGILKLNGLSGNTIYEKTITEDSILYDNTSIGMASCVFNNTPYFVGELETYHVYNFERSRLTFIKLDPSSGNPLIKKYIEGNYQFPSKTLYIENYSSSKMLILKQEGRVLKMAMYDQFKNILWEKTFSNEYYFFGGNLSIASNGDIWFSAYTRPEWNTIPFYSETTDNIYVYQLNSSGNIKNHYSFYSGVINSFPVELHSDKSNTFIFYQKNNIICFRKISSLTLSQENNTQITFNNIDSHSNYYFDIDTAKALLFGYRSGATRLIELDKNLMTTTNLAIIKKPLKTINYVYKFNSNSAVLCGKDSINRESIGLYNITKKDTIWTKLLSTNNSEVLKCVIDSSKKFIYSISHNANNILIRKIELSSGAQIWQYTYNGIANLDDFPFDISYDRRRGQIVTAGFETVDSINKNALIIVLDTLGNLVDKTIKKGDFPGSNSAICSQVLRDGSLWVGGNLNNNLYGLSGFIYEMRASLCSSSYSSQNIVSCDHYTWHGKSYKLSGTYVDTIPNIGGCDSIMTLNLTINHVDASVKASSTHSLFANATNATYQWLDCDNNYTAISGAINQSYSPLVGGNYSVFVTQNGCKDTSSCYNALSCRSASIQNIVSCDHYVWNGKNYNLSGTYVDTIRNIWGCDSIMTLNLTINSVDTSINASSTHLLIANATNATYQWLSCNNIYSIISGATNQTYSPLISGNYSVVITQNGCKDTSSCYQVLITGVSEIGKEDKFYVYPNPITGLFSVEHNTIVNGTYEISDITGTIIKKGSLMNKKTVIDLTGIESGVFLLKIDKQTIRLIKQ